MRALIAKLNGEPASLVLVVHVAYPNANYVRKVESRICNHGEIVAELYLRAPDKNGTYQVSQLRNSNPQHETPQDHLEATAKHRPDPE